MESIEVEVVFADRGRQRLVVLELPVGSTVGTAVHRSGLLEEFPQIELARNPLGIFGRIVTLDSPLQNRDRVEIYRPLLISPTEARRLRATRKKPRL